MSPLNGDFWAVSQCTPILPICHTPILPISGEVEGATFWFQREGDVGTMGRADLVFVLKLEQHPLFERMGDDLWLKSTEELTVAQPDEPFWCRKPHPMPIA